jgi:hypothetical protein
MILPESLIPSSKIKAANKQESQPSCEGNEELHTIKLTWRSGGGIQYLQEDLQRLFGGPEFGLLDHIGLGSKRRSALLSYAVR